MVDALCTTYGDKIAEEEEGVEGSTSDRNYFAFPTLEKLATIRETSLRSMGFGYRARYIPTAAKQILEKDVEGMHESSLLPCTLSR